MNESINCQADNVTFQTYDLDAFWVTCGYRYDLPGEPLIPPLPPVVVVPAAPVPEPSSALLVVAGLLVVAVARRLRRRA